jgi:hypothetical protein
MLGRADDEVTHRSNQQMLAAFLQHSEHTHTPKHMQVPRW